MRLASSASKADVSFLCSWKSRARRDVHLELARAARHVEFVGGESYDPAIAGNSVIGITIRDGDAGAVGASRCHLQRRTLEIAHGEHGNLAVREAAREIGGEGLENHMPVIGHLGPVAVAIAEPIGVSTCYGLLAELQIDRHDLSEVRSEYRGSTPGEGEVTAVARE